MGAQDYYLYTITHKINNKNLLYSTGNHIQYLVITYYRKQFGKVNIYIHIYTHIYIYIYTHTYIYTYISL